MAFETITSLKNEIIKTVQSLRERKFRDQSQQTIIDGVRELAMAVKANVSIIQVFMRSKQMPCDELAQVLSVLRNKKTKIYEVSDAVFEKIAFGDREQGVVAVCQPQLSLLEDLNVSKRPLWVVVESVEKPGNLGAILRTCDAAGVDGLIVCDPRTDVYNPNVIRASLGAVFTVSVAVGTKEAVWKFLKDRRCRIMATLPEALSAYWTVDFTQSTAILLGSEQEGLSEFWHHKADQKIQVPMTGKVNSLNVSITAALMMYEAVRQRQTKA